MTSKLVGGNVTVMLFSFTGYKQDNKSYVFAMFNVLTSLNMFSILLCCSFQEAFS